MPVLDISSSEFRNIFGSKKFDLPRRWDGRDFKKTLDALFEEYINQVKATPGIPSAEAELVEKICSQLSQTVKYYFEGSPVAAYRAFKSAMGYMWESPMLVQTSHVESPLFRLANVGDNAVYDRKRVFHTPYSLRGKVSTSRYSIAGHPSLYLGTSLPLCWEELHLAPQDFAIAAAYKLKNPSMKEIKILDLGLKPEDLMEENRFNGKKGNASSSERGSYLLWYPLVAACSFIRANKKDPFAAEYIIPQLLMQWIRNQVRAKKDWEQGASNGKLYLPRTNADLIGIRYFSCASKRTFKRASKQTSQQDSKQTSQQDSKQTSQQDSKQDSKQTSEQGPDMALDYVFPTSGEGCAANPDYCALLSDVFTMTEPAYLLDYPDVEECENYLQSIDDKDYKNPLS